MEVFTYYVEQITTLFGIVVQVVEAVDHHCLARNDQLMYTRKGMTMGTSTYVFKL